MAAFGMKWGYKSQLEALERHFGIDEHERRSTDAEQQEERRQELRLRTEAALRWEPADPEGEGDEPVQAYIAAMPGWKRSLGERLDRLIARTVPEVHKAVKWNQPFYGHKGEGWFAFRCYTNYVQLQFFRGTSLIPFRPRRPSTTRCVTSTSTKTTTSTRASSSPGSNRQATCPARRCRAAGHRPRSAGRGSVPRQFHAATSSIIPSTRRKRRFDGFQDDSTAGSSSWPPGRRHRYVKRLGSGDQLATPPTRSRLRSSSARLTEPGATPMIRLKARLKAASDW